MRLICIALALLLTACAPDRAELVLKGKSYLMTDTAKCERLALVTGGVCYSDDGSDIERAGE
jgi:hypothetical protein